MEYFEENIISFTFTP